MPEHFFEDQFPWLWRAWAEVLDNMNLMILSVTITMRSREIKSTVIRELECCEMGRGSRSLVGCLGVQDCAQAEQDLTNFVTSEYIMAKQNLFSTNLILLMNVQMSGAEVLFRSSEQSEHLSDFIHVSVKGRGSTGKYFQENIYSLYYQSIFQAQLCHSSLMSTGNPTS